jgi:prepilin-type processing-associated H-X9-DG protein
VSLLGITDGTSNTILFGERYNYDPLWTTYTNASGGAWTNALFCAIFSPWGSSSAASGGAEGVGYFVLNYTFSQQGLYTTPVNPTSAGSFNLPYRARAFGSGHTGGANFVFCDGSVHFLSNAINNESALPGETLLQALCTRAGGEVVDGSQY